MSFVVALGPIPQDPVVLLHAHIRRNLKSVKVFAFVVQQSDDVLRQIGLINERSK